MQKMESVMNHYRERWIRSIYANIHGHVDNSGGRQSEAENNGTTGNCGGHDAISESADNRGVMMRGDAQQIVRRSLHADQSE